MVGWMNRAYEARDRRSFFKIQLIAVGVTLLFSIFVMLSTVLLFFRRFACQAPTVKGGLRHIQFASKLGSAAYWMTRWLIIFAF